jgi:hypothetical protein
MTQSAPGGRRPPASTLPNQADNSPVGPRGINDDHAGAATMEIAGLNQSLAGNSAPKDRAGALSCTHLKQFYGI